MVRLFKLSQTLIYATPLILGWVILEQNLGLALPNSSLEQGQNFYEQGQYQTAIEWLQTQLKATRQRGDRLGEAATLSNLALTYSEVGAWKQANESIQLSLVIVQKRAGVQSQELLAQVLNTKGQIQLAQGDAEASLDTWKQAERIFELLDQPAGKLRSRINQSQALQNLGFYRRSILVLTDVIAEIRGMPNSVEKVTSLRSISEAFGKVGDLNQAQFAAKESLAIAGRMKLGEEFARSAVSLGNLEANRGAYSVSLTYYEEALRRTRSPKTQINSHLNALRSHLALGNIEQVQRLWPQLLKQLNDRPPTAHTVKAQLNLAHSLARLRILVPDSVSPLVLAQLLAYAQQNAKTLGDRRLESYSLGKLGALYEQLGQYSEAKTITQRALNLVSAQSFSEEIAYQWQWQLGRIESLQGNRKGAIAYYQSAVTLLSGLRQDITTSNPDIQFTFQDQVEPLYREFVSLLLSGSEPNSQNLEAARQAIESLQLAELDNFFRAACLDITPVIVDRVDRSAAVIYPIILPDQLAVIVRLPGEALNLYTYPVSERQVAKVTNQLRQSLRQPNDTRYKQASQQLYNWLLRPAMADIEQSNIDTLVFIPDGVLRSIPLGTLNNGDRFVIEDYAVALTPGLQLLQAGVERRERSQVLVAGLSKAQNRFPALIHVKKEVLGIQDRLRHQTFMDEDFTQQNLEKAIEARSFSLMHLATHGQFGSDLQGTFLQAWGEQMDIDRLREVLRNSELRYRSSLDLLVLSACETAVGDNRAVLGLAGIAARSGAKSTLASLWKVNDESTSVLMEKFYQALGDRSVSKAEALRRAQRSMLQDSSNEKKHPYYWSAFVLVGGWQ